jgi:hypothetical protein
MEDLGQGMTRISTCFYKADCYWDMCLHKKAFHNEPKKEEDSDPFIKQRVREISKILSAN